MTYETLKGEKLRKFIARKGLFVRLPIPETYKSVESEIALGRSILDRAILDCLEDEEVVDWFDVNDEEFTTICFIANLDPVKVEENFKTVYRKLKDE